MVSAVPVSLALKPIERSLKAIWGCMKHQDSDNISMAEALRARVQNAVAHSTPKPMHTPGEHHLAGILVIEDAVVVSEADLSQNPPLWL